MRALLDAARERRADLHRCLDVDDRLERVVVDENELGAVLRRGLGLGHDERHRLSGEHDLLARQRLGRPVGAGRRRRQVGRRQHGDDTGQRKRGFPVDGRDQRVRLAREHEARVQQAVDLAVRCKAGLAGDLLRCVVPRPRDPDHGVHDASSFARRSASSVARPTTTWASERR